MAAGIGGKLEANFLMLEGKCCYSQIQVSHQPCATCFGPTCIMAARGSQHQLIMLSYLHAINPCTPTASQTCSGIAWKLTTAHPCGAAGHPSQPPYNCSASVSDWLLFNCALATSCSCLVSTSIAKVSWGEVPLALTVPEPRHFRGASAGFMGWASVASSLSRTQRAMET